ncbi:AAA family ATPase [Serratia ureilytica]|uniref:AAA family ATPase n=1 Tax=Serratia TaxID=613 RepID=UPI00164E6A8C|nr:AAA family ATPase [Serratia ureilytica]QNL00845.1 AAA family ATPase [Serratia ureilytica]
MRINRIELSNFRKYASACINFHPQFTLLIGNNASGKTTILDALAMLLSTYFQGARIATGGTTLKKSDARYIVVEKEGQVFLEPQHGVWLKASAALPEVENIVEWIRELGDRGGKAKELITHGADIRKQVAKGLSPELPLLCYYGAGRLWELHRDVKTEHPGSQLDAYRYCLDPKSDQYVFQKWFKRLTLSELQRRTEIPALQVVRNAIIQCIPGAKNFIFDINEETLLIELEREGIVRFSDLSDGFRNMVAMVADIAHRCAKLNPHFGDAAAKLTQGTILIDELDLHLHPKWQRRVISDLRSAFPKIQFIATTHSPFIIQSANVGEVIDLDNLDTSERTQEDIKALDNVAAVVPEALYTGKSIEDIVETIMDVPVPQRSQRYQEMYDAAKEYYSLLEDGKNATDYEKNEIKRKLDKLTAPFSDNVAYHAFLEMERVNAGLGRTQQGDDE